MAATALIATATAGGIAATTGLASTVEAATAAATAGIAATAAGVASGCSASATWVSCADIVVDGRAVAVVRARFGCVVAAHDVAVRAGAVDVDVAIAGSARVRFAAYVAVTLAISVVFLAGIIVSNVTALSVVWVAGTALDVVASVIAVVVTADARATVSTEAVMSAAILMAAVEAGPAWTV